ncbi:hypothetical protein HPB49_018244 [Dermacentor silvarum]|uniref:Uncharacterized protein n=1 Tax=Dermacentor silvarum TaxID=543639 RepID=A0ACB8CSL2_DERSI|nr:hypothetical protein HPB49_018244 [Dermacentor silvarum]
MTTADPYGDLLLAAVILAGIIALLAVLWLLMRKYTVVPSAPERPTGEALNGATEAHQPKKTGEAGSTQTQALTDHKTTEAVAAPVEPALSSPLSGRASVDEAAEGAKSPVRRIVDAARRATVAVSRAVKEQTTNVLEVLSSGADAVQGSPATSIALSSGRVSADALANKVPSPLLRHESQVRTMPSPATLMHKPADLPKNEATVYKKFPFLALTRRQPPESKYEAKPSQTSLPTGFDMGPRQDDAAISASGGIVGDKGVSSPGRGQGTSAADLSGAHASSAEEHSPEDQSAPSSPKHTSNISRGAPSSKQKRKSLPEGEVGSLTSSTVDNKQVDGGPAASLSCRRSSTRSRGSQKSVRSDLKAEGACTEEVSPPPGWVDPATARDQRPSDVIPQEHSSVVDSSPEP